MVVTRVLLGTMVSPSRKSTVEISPVRRPAARHAAHSIVAVVVLPSVPVTPAMVSDREGWPWMAAARALRARREFADRDHGHVRRHRWVERVLGHDRDRATGHCGGGMGVTVLAPARHRHEERTWPDLAGVVRHRGDLDPRLADVGGHDPGFTEEVAQANHVAAVSVRAAPGTPRSDLNHDWIGRVLGTIRSCRALATSSTTPAASSPR